VNGDDDASANDPRDPDPHAAQELDPASGASDDPRVDPTPDRRQTDSGPAKP